MFVDIVFLFLFIGALVLGFFQGVVRLAVILVAFYLSLVLASFYFFSFGKFLVKSFHTTTSVGQYVGFVIVMLVALALLTAAGLYTFRYAKLPGQLLYVDRISGMFLGMVFGSLLLGIFGVLLWNLMIERGAETLELPIMHWLGRSVRNSFLMGYFSDYVLPRAYDFADPVLPDSARIIFAVSQ